MKHETTVDAYIAAANPDVRATLKAVRAMIRKTIPDAQEGIAYGMPAYMWKSKPLFYFAAMKGHLGLYPTPGPIRVCADALGDFSTSKGCVRVPYDSTIPAKLIRALLVARKKEIQDSLG